jgi:hypothetical protein
MRMLSWTGIGKQGRDPGCDGTPGVYSPGVPRVDGARFLPNRAALDYFPSVAIAARTLAL